MEDVRNACKILIGKSEKKRPLGRPRHGWKGNIRMDLRETVGGCELDSSSLGKGTVVSSCEYDDKPLCFIKGG